MRASIKLFHWLPRIICMLAIAFVSLFAFDSFSPDLSFWEQMGGFLIHLIPSFILMGILILAWKKERVGGIIFIILGTILSVVLFAHNYKVNNSIWTSLLVILAISIPFVIVGVLFLVSDKLKKKASSTSSGDDVNNENE